MISKGKRIITRNLCPRFIPVLRSVGNRLPLHKGHALSPEPQETTELDPTTKDPDIIKKRTLIEDIIENLVIEVYEFCDAIDGGPDS